MKNTFFEVDHKGLGKLIERKGKHFIPYELIQNAWDQRVSRVQIEMNYLDGRRAEIIVEDDDPNGFRDLSHAYTLFAESDKKGEPLKRGRFNLGEKLVLAACEEGEISTTKGTISFDRYGRHNKRIKRKMGSRIRAMVKMTKPEFEECKQAVLRLIPPLGIDTYFNGTLLNHLTPIATIEETLPTEVADEEGRLRSTRRKTSVELYKPINNQHGFLYEMGIPVVESNMPFHVNVGQKIPLNMDRDNVPPAYARSIKTMTLNATIDLLNEDMASENWVNDAITEERCDIGAIEKVVQKRFGSNVVVYDPNDPESRSRAQAAGYAVINGRELPKGVCKKMREHGLLKTTHEVAPSNNELHINLKIVSEHEWTSGMRHIADFVENISREVIGKTVTVLFLNNSDYNAVADYGMGKLRFNLGKTGKALFDYGISKEVMELVIHELAHEYEGNHLSDNYHESCCKIGSQMTSLALRQPSIFQ